MKSYTDLEQSKKLAEILPIESADMNWHELPFTGFFARAFPYKHDNGATEGIFPCWSLAALLDVLPDEVGDNYYLTLDKEGKEYCCCYEDNNGNSFRHCFSDNPVDACYKMVLKLHEQKLL
jgi:hypothetical protein